MMINELSGGKKSEKESEAEKKEELLQDSCVISGSNASTSAET